MRGWCVIVAAVMEGNSDEEETQGFHTLGLALFRGLGGDLRIFNGRVPSWPEAQQAAVLGREFAEQFDIPFFFPSPDRPKEDTPHWWEQEQAYPCKE